LAKITNFHDIGKKHAKKLLQVGVGTSDRLLLVASHPQGRIDLQQMTKIPRKKILEWVKLADLIRIKGLGGKYVDLLEEAGIKSIAELRTRKPESLHKILLAINEDKHLVLRLPSPKEIERWIIDAKSIKPKVRA
jgi:predicted flap endonuclease-1-like 5' DNA nuclease